MREKNLDYTVAICALARDCEDQLRRNIPRIEELRKRFRNSYVVVIENDSKDLTKQLLHDWELNNDNVKIISNDFNTVTIPQTMQNGFNPTTSLHRIGRMASYRNMYLEYVESLQNIDFVIMVDIDVYNFDPNEIVNAFVNAPKDWGGIFSFGYTDSRIFGRNFKALYHDLYALKLTDASDNYFVTFAEMFKNSKKMSSLLKKDKYVPVLSAFGGVGIYKREALQGLRYKAETNNDSVIEAVCEHIPLNYEITKKGFKNYVCRDLKVYYGESNKLMLLRALLPLKVFKFLALVFTFKRLKA